MRPEDIKVGKTYHHYNSKTAIRTVLGIGPEYRPDVWLGKGKPPDEPGVLFLDHRTYERRNLYLSSFAVWATTYEL